MPAGLRSPEISSPFGHQRREGGSNKSYNERIVVTTVSVTPILFFQLRLDADLLSRPNARGAAQPGNLFPQFPQMSAQQIS